MSISGAIIYSSYTLFKSITIIHQAHFAWCLYKIYKNIPTTFTNVLLLK